ncbi:MAG TPA: hypothetical protein VEB41_10020 [Burkholderiales bacterium]|nr:hypothetical protein [Burkholderiales bacterium]
MNLRRFLVVLAIVALPATAQEPLGMVLDVQGAVSAPEAGKAAKVEMLSYLRPNMTLELSAGSALTVTWYADSRELRFAGPARLRVLKDRIQVVQGSGAAERALGEEKVAATKSPRLAQATITMRSMSVPPPPGATSGPAPKAERPKPAESAPLSDWVLYASALEEAGLKADAKAVWKKLAAERPGEPRLKALAER